MKPSSRPGKRPNTSFWLLAAALVLAGAVSWLHQATYDFENDDAYISYRYARHWAEGMGPVFNPGERVEGYSNFLLVGILALVHRLGGDVVVASRSLGTLSLWGLVLLAYLFASRRLGRGPGLALAASLAMALHGGLACWARSGMETVPLAFALLLAQYVFLGELPRQRSHWRSGFLFAVVALLRSDGFVHVGATALFLAVQRQHRRRLWTLLLPFALITAPYFLWRWQYYGHFFPNPYYLRTGGDFHQQLRGLFYVANFIVPFGGLLLFAAPLLLFWLRDPERDTARTYLATATIVFGAYVVWVGGDYMPMARFFVPIIPALVLLQLETIAELASKFERPAQRRAAVAILTGVTALSGLLPTLNPRRQPQNRAIIARVQVEEWTLAGQWLKSHMPPGTLLAAEPVGALAYFSELPIVDMLGVNDEHIAHLQTANLGHSTAGHEKRDFDYVLSRRPQLLFRGVWPECTGDGDTIAYPNSSTYTLHCVSLGQGPLANDLGEVHQVPLFLRYEERLARSN